MLSTKTKTKKINVVAKSPHNPRWCFAIGGPLPAIQPEGNFPVTPFEKFRTTMAIIVTVIFCQQSWYDKLLEPMRETPTSAV